MDPGEHELAQGSRRLAAPPQHAPDPVMAVQLDRAVGGRVGIGADHHADRRLPAVMAFDDLVQVQVDQDVAVDDQKGAARQELAGLFDAAAGAQNGRLPRVANPHAQGGAVAERVGDFLPVVMEVDDDVGNAVAFQEQQRVVDQRPICDGQERFRQLVGQGPETGGQAGREDHGFHCWAFMGQPAPARRAPGAPAAVSARGSAGSLPGRSRACAGWPPGSGHSASPSRCRRSGRPP